MFEQNLTIFPQVCDWFTNARAQIKRKEKLNREPKNDLSQEMIDVSDESESGSSFNEKDKPNSKGKNSRRGRLKSIWTGLINKIHIAGKYISKNNLSKATA